MLLREARVVWPVNAQGHRRLRREFVQHFGGYTETEGRGGWMNNAGELEQEQVRVYDVAMPPVEKNDALLRHIVRAVLNDSREAAAYVRYANGEVEIVDRDEA